MLGAWLGTFFVFAWQRQMTKKQEFLNQALELIHYKVGGLQIDGIDLDKLSFQAIGTTNACIFYFRRFRRFDTTS